jgi:hypothetical protein
MFFKSKISFTQNFLQTRGPANNRAPIFLSYKPLNLRASGVTVSNTNSLLFTPSKTTHLFPIDIITDIINFITH